MGKRVDDAFPTKGRRAGWEWADPSMIETLLERRRQQLLAEQVRREIERLRAEPPE